MGGIRRPDQAPIHVDRERFRLGGLKKYSGLRRRHIHAHRCRRIRVVPVHQEFQLSIRGRVIRDQTR